MNRQLTDAERTALLRKRAVSLNACLSKSLSVMSPPENITVSEWAERKRRLSSEASAETGLWRTSRTPYLREIMDSFTDPKVRHIVLVAASQVGKSEFINNCIGYIIDEDPSSILFVHPTVGDARDYSQLRIAPMIRDCPTLSAKVADPKSRDSGNTILQKKYPGGILTMCGSTEAHALASKPIRYVFGDERDRWASSAGNEGDPWALAMARQTTFYNAKAVEVSTPTVKGASHIESAYNTGTMERYCTQCPDCGEYSEIRFSDIRFEYDTVSHAGKKTYKLKTIVHVCPKCGAVHSEIEMKHSPAKWIADNPDAYAKGTRSFWLNAFVSPWALWESIIQEFLDAKDDPRKLQVVFNTRFGELWEDRGDVENEDSIMSRREVYNAELPDGVLVLTAGIDTQDNRLEYEVVGHGRLGETWGIQYGVIMGRPDGAEVWQAVDDLLDHEFAFANGVKLKLSLAFMDEGGHYTQNVREECRKRFAKNLFCVKGIGGESVPYTSPPKKQAIKVNQRITGYAWQFQIGVDAGKQKIMDNIKVQTPGPNYCHFPIRDEYGYGYFSRLLSEHLVYNKNKKSNMWEWKKIPGHERNEALDIRNYANAAFVAAKKDLDAIERRIREGKTLTQQPRPKPKQQPQRRTVNKYLDEW